jgi:two-component system chemotaxis response regulator CheY
MQIDYSKYRILIIEDEEYTRGIIARLLRQIGFQSVYTAGSGKEGLSEAVRCKPHLILCDIHMPNGDGLTFHKMLRNFKLDAVRSIPVIFLTADQNRETIMAAKGVGARGYLVKPVSLTDLKNKVDAVLA